MSEATTEVTVLSDSMSYVLPGQPEQLPFGQTFAYGSGVRGQDIKVRTADLERFQMLGAVAELDSYAARAAKAAPRKGVPGPDQIALAATPEARLLLENEREGFLAPDIEPDKGDDPNAIGVRTEALAGVNALDRTALATLNVTELRLVGQRYGVAVEADDTFDTLTEKIQLAAATQLVAHSGHDVGGQATGSGFTGPGGSNPAPKELLDAQTPADDRTADNSGSGSGSGKSAGGKSPSRMNVGELDAKYGSVEGYPAGGNRKEKRAFAADREAKSSA